VFTIIAKPSEELILNLPRVKDIGILISSAITNMVAEIGTKKKVPVNYNFAHIIIHMVLNPFPPHHVRIMNGCMSHLSAILIRYNVV
jgi:hypothetical protein